MRRDGLCFDVGEFGCGILKSHGGNRSQYRRMMSIDSYIPNMKSLQGVFSTGYTLQLISHHL